MNEQLTILKQEMKTLKLTLKERESIGGCIKEFGVFLEVVKTIILTAEPKYFFKQKRGRKRSHKEIGDTLLWKRRSDFREEKEVFWLYLIRNLILMT